MDSFYSLKPDALALNLKVIPGSRELKIVGVKNNELVIKLNVQPEKGRANKALIGLLSRATRTAKTAITIDKGLSSRHKTVLLPLKTEPFFKQFL